MDIEQYDITIHQEKLAIKLYRASRVSPAPTLLLCHGFFGIQDAQLPEFARRFAQAGYNAVTFDYRGFGHSEGEAGRIIPERQIDDIEAVLAWCRQQPSVIAERIALWGTSLGGCHALEVAARHPEIKCLICQMGFADGEQLVTGDMGMDEKKRFLTTMERMERKRRLTGSELWVPIIGVMTDEESRVFFEKQKKRFPALDIKIPYLTVYETIHYHPAQAAARLTQPALMVYAQNDKVIALEYGLALYQAVASEKCCHIQPKARHYDMFSGPHFEQNIERQLSWLSEYL